MEGVLRGTEGLTHPPPQDDSMTMNGPTEEDSNYIADCGFSTADMQAQVDAYHTTITQFDEAVYAAGGVRLGSGGVASCGSECAPTHSLRGVSTAFLTFPSFPPRKFTWMMMKWDGARLNTDLNNTTDTASCKAILEAACVPSPPKWNYFEGYALPHGGFGASPQSFTDYTAEFLLTRGPYAILGYTWFGCTNGGTENPRAPEWDNEYGVPLNTCSETSPGSGIFSREWEQATVSWDCNARHGKIARK